MGCRAGLWAVAMLLLAPGAWAIAGDDDVDRQIRFWEARKDVDAEDDIATTKLGTAYLLKARSSGEYSYYRKAETTLRKATTINPKSYDARVALAFALGAQHRFREAIELAEKAVKDQPKEADAYGILGDAAMEIGDLKRAESAYDTLVDLAPGLFAYGRIANLKQAKGDAAGALETLAKAIESGKARGASKDEIARCQVARGEIHWSHGRLDEADREYRLALEVTPEGYLPLEHLAELRATQGKHDEAMKIYRRVIELAPRPEFFEAVGDLCVSMGRADEAKSWHAKALGGYKAVVARGDIGYFRHLAHFYSDVQPVPAEAVSWARKDVDVRPEAASYDTLAWAFYRAGDDAAALSAIEKALAPGSGDARMLYHAGMIHHRAGKAETARAYLRRALEINPKIAEAEAIRRLLMES